MKNEKRKITRHQKILEAAVELFQRSHDIKRVSLEAIARQAGVSPTTIYNHFNTREELLCEVVKSLMRQTLERNRQIVRSDIPFSQKLISIMSTKLEMVDRMDAEIIDKMLDQDSTIAPFIDEIWESEIRPLWREMMADGKQQGYVAPSLDEEAILLYVDVLRAGLSARPDIMENYKEKMPLIEQLTRIMFYGFLQKDIDLFRKEGTRPDD